MNTTATALAALAPADSSTLLLAVLGLAAAWALATLATKAGW